MKIIIRQPKSREMYIPLILLSFETAVRNKHLQQKET